MLRRSSSDSTSLSMKQAIETFLDGSKAIDVVSLDLRGKTDIADYMIIASGTSNRHIDSIAKNLLQHIKDSGLPCPDIEGAGHSDWVLLDTPYVIVHLFKPEARAEYALEKMWSAEFTDESEETELVS